MLVAKTKLYVFTINFFSKGFCEILLSCVWGIYHALNERGNDYVADYRGIVFNVITKFWAETGQKSSLIMND